MKKFYAVPVAALGILIGGSVGFANDHAEIEGPFESPMEVTATCLECHEDAAQQVMATSHWTWEREQVVNGKNVVRGKKNSFNNFCISINANWARCTSCHVGYGWVDDSFDFTDENKVDCLICHDTTGTYKKPGAGAGMPAGYTGKASMDKKKVDLVKVAQNAGLPDRDNCLVCHANGGGGNNVKPGDMSMAMSKPSQEIDVHMAADGLNFSCQQCHKTDSHAIPGKSLIVSPGVKTTMDCTDCHGETPHRYFPTAKQYNKHAKKIACQTCHVSHFAKGDATKMTWDWSKAMSPAELKKAGKEKIVKEHGHKTYIFKKGKFTYEEDVVPTYAWFNGDAGAYTIGDKIDPTKVTKLNYPLGSKDDGVSKIMPFKIHKAVQPYDTKNNYLVTPKVFGFKGDKEAYWVNFDWTKAITAGMKATGLEFSGEHDFTKTWTYWPINHQVDPKAKALKCLNCHKEGNRLDWKALGYEDDPMKLKKMSKH
ncbi:MAG: tetrathionate reductase family octaheme c-type cytochrome [Thermodesulfobacteriota bacterium]